MQPSPSKARYGLSRLDGYVLSELRMLASELPPGTSSAGRTCPFCRGGSSAERSFSITALDSSRAAYLCHRASCGARGFIDGAVGSFAAVPIPQQPDQAVYTAEIRGLGEYWVSCLVERFGFTKDEVHRLAWAEEVNTGRLVVYIRDPFSKVCGVHTRAREGQYPKTRDYRRSEHYVGWFFPEGTGNESCKGPIILVEDVLSAAKVSTAGFVAVSLMGSNLSLEQLGDIQAVSQGGTVALALDRDATGKAIELASRYRFLSGGNLIPMLLSKDLKYHTKEEIVQMVGDVIGSSE